MKTSNYVKALVCEYDRGNITVGKVYPCLYERIQDNDNYTLEIVTERWGFSCAHLGTDNWKYCDKDGNLLNEDEAGK